MKTGVDFKRGRAIATSAAALSSVIVTGCADGTNAVSPPAPRNTNSEIVAAYGNSEQELTRVISDARAFAKIARFVTVTNGAVEHVFPPTAIVTRTGHVLIVHAYGHTYVWPLSNVSLSYSGAGPIEMSALPTVSAPYTDKTVMAIASFASHTARLNNARRECNDCYVFVAASRTTPSNMPATVRDPWQVTPDYRPWVDPKVPPSDPVASSLGRYTRTKREDLSICTIDGFVENSGSGWCSGIYYLSPGYYSSGGSGGSLPPPPPVYTYISVGMSTAGSQVSSGNVNVPTAGHLYVQEWTGNWPTISPVGPILQAGNVQGKLQFAVFPQNPTTDFQSFLLTNQQQTTPDYPTYWQHLVDTKNRYQSRSSIMPNYDPTNMNSNAWAYGLMLYAGDFSAQEIQTNIGLDESLSALTAYAWPNGTQLQPNFQ